MAGGLASKVLIGLANIMIIKFLTKSEYAALSNFQFIQTLMSGLIFSPFLLASVLGVNLFEMQNMRRLFSALNLFQIILVFVCLLAAFLYGDDLADDLFHKPQFYYPILMGLISSIFLTFQNIILSSHQASESYSSYNLINLLRPVFLILLLTAFHFTHTLSFFTAASAFLLSYLLSVAGDLSKITEAVSFKGLMFRVKQFVWFWKSLQYLILFFFVRAMLDHIARFMVSRHFTVEDNAAFGVSFQYYAMADLVIYSAHVAFMNIFTREQKAVARKKYINWLKATGLLSLFGLASLWFAEPLFVMINGAQYREAYPVFAMFMAGISIYLCFSPVIYAIAERRTFKTLFVLSLAALLWQLGMTWFASEKQSLVLMAFACVSARGLIYLSSFFLYFRRA